MSWLSAGLLPVGIHGLAQLRIWRCVLPVISHRTEVGYRFDLILIDTNRATSSLLVLTSSRRFPQSWPHVSHTLSAIMPHCLMLPMALKVMVYRLTRCP